MTRFIQGIRSHILQSSTEFFRHRGVRLIGANAPTAFKNVVEVKIMRTEKKQNGSKAAALFALTTLFGLSTAANAESHGFSALGGYLFDTRSQVVRSGFNECWRTERWRPANRAAECGGAKAPKPAASPPQIQEPPATPAATPPPPEPQSEVIVRAINLGRVNFAFDRYNLNNPAVETLDKLAVELRMDDSIEGLDIVGHTDSVGNEQYNQRLSERRANAVADYLENQGIVRSIMSVTGRGESEPVASNATPEGRAANRRTEIWVRRRTPINR